MFLRRLGPLFSSIKESTGIVGLDVVPNAKQVLIGIYQQTLSALQVGLRCSARVALWPRKCLSAVSTRPCLMSWSRYGASLLSNASACMDPVPIGENGRTEAAQPLSSSGSLGPGPAGEVKGVESAVSYQAFAAARARGEVCRDSDRFATSGVAWMGKGDRNPGQAQPTLRCQCRPQSSQSPEAKEIPDITAAARPRRLRLVAACSQHEQVMLLWPSCRALSLPHWFNSDVFSLGPPVEWTSAGDSPGRSLPAERGEGDKAPA